MEQESRNAKAWNQASSEITKINEKADTLAGVASNINIMVNAR